MEWIVMMRVMLEYSPDHKMSRKKSLALSIAGAKERESAVLSSSFDFDIISRFSPRLFPMKTGPKSREELARDRFRAELDTAINVLHPHVARQLKALVMETVEMAWNALEVVPDLSVRDRSCLIQDAYASLHHHTKAFPNVEAGSMVESVERFICDAFYSDLFAGTSNAEDAMDMSLSERIRSLRWVTAGFLKTRLHLESTPVSDQIQLAIRELLDVDHHRCPKDKLTTLHRAAEAVLNALRLSTGKPASADDFLPALIYVVLIANPSRLQSNLDYINRFAWPYNTTFGELGYYFTSLCSAKDFIQNVSPGDLDVAAEDFEAYTFSCSPSSLSADHQSLSPPPPRVLGDGEGGWAYTFSCSPSSLSSDHQSLSPPPPRVLGDGEGGWAYTFSCSPSSLSSDHQSLSPPPPRVLGDGGGGWRFVFEAAVEAEAPGPSSSSSSKHNDDLLFDLQVNP